jgi:hypothetical protein
VTHYRQQLREEAVALLKALDLPAIGPRVYGTVFFAIKRDELPIVTVWLDGELIETESGQYARTVTLMVSVFMAAGDLVENAVDDVCARIELGFDATLSGLARRGKLIEMRAERSTEGSQEYMRADLAYELLYFTNPQNPLTQAA